MNKPTYFNQFKNIWNTLPSDSKKTSDLLYIILLGFLIGMFTGAVIAVFRITTSAAFAGLIAWTGKHHSILEVAGWVIIAGLAALATGRLVLNQAIRFGGAKWIMDAIADGQTRPWLKILIPKFVGSWLVMACGISVGREGPCIEMGAATALGLKNFDKKQYIERRYFILGGCAAGLAAAFSAPFAGICYVYEIMKEKFSPILLTFLLGGSFGVFFSVTLVFGLDVMLPVGATPLPGLKDFWLVALLGVFAGSGGIAYNYLLRISKYLYARQRLLSIRFRPLAPFLGAAIMVFIFPALTGEGLTIFASMENGQALPGYLLFFVLAKLVFTAFCYGSDIPAGLMVPVICIGGVLGGVFANLAQTMGLLDADYFSTCLALGMCSAFAATERAPITGLVLITEMTASWEASPGMLLAGAIAALCGRLAKVKAV